MRLNSEYISAILTVTFHAGSVEACRARADGVSHKTVSIFT